MGTSMAASGDDADRDGWGRRPGVDRVPVMHTVDPLEGKGQRRGGRTAVRSTGGCGFPQWCAETRHRHAGAPPAAAASVDRIPDRGGPMAAFVVTLIVVVGVNTLLWVSAGV